MATFLAEIRAGETKLVGGLALLSGYINKVRREEENVLRARIKGLVEKL